MLLLFFGITTFISCTSSSSDSEKKKDSKPNIIYILADDLGYGEIGAYGQTKIETPNIDALAINGMIFTQHYTGAPVCAPARAVLLTGQHLGHTFVRGNDEWRERGDVWSYEAMVKDSTLEGQRPLPQGTVTMANVLKDAGYRTGMFGKWGLGAPHTESIPTKMGFDYFFGYNCQRIAHTFNPIHMYENEKRYIINKDTIAPTTGLDPGADPYDPASYAKYQQAGYSPEISFEKLMGFVREVDNDPFFLYWASPIPHVPLQAPKDWVDHYVEKFGDEEPYYFFEGGKKKSYFPVRYPHATYAAMISYLDENIGKLVDYLKEKDLYDNTLIVFTSDNGPTFTGGADSPWFDSGGPFASEYGRGKGFLYEGGIRIPMIASWANKIKPGSKTEHISAFYDVMPTFCEIAGAETPSNTDGISFLDAMTMEGEQKEHEYMYWEYPEYGGQVAVRMGKWKILWKDMKKGNKEVEVYNLEDDLEELNNIADQHPELVTKLYEIIKKEHETPEIERFRMEALEEVYTSK
ncbi:UNVERIFIED_CONTAM: hypothetical protein GTU68_027176 [Idotea baltica]|nr:hypothetical protein [Idotea baltica]